MSNIFLAVRKDHGISRTRPNTTQARFFCGCKSAKLWAATHSHGSSL